MSAEPAVPRLEALRTAIKAARATKHGYPTQFTDGLNAGLDLALDHIEREIHWTKHIDAAVAAAQPQ